MFEKKKEDKPVSPAVNSTLVKNPVRPNPEKEETIREKRIWNLRNVFIAFWIFVLFTAIGIAVSGFLSLKIEERVFVWTALVIAYAIILFFLLEPSKLREIDRKETKTVEKQIFRDVVRTVDRPVVKEVIKEVEKPVYYSVDKPVIQEVIKEIEKPVYYPVSRPKLNIPKYEYVASKLTKIYHKSNCRLGKSIKKKYKEYTNDPKEFQRRQYAPCKSCVTKEVNV